MTTLYIILFIITFLLFALGAFAGYIEGDESCKLEGEE